MLKRLSGIGTGAAIIAGVILLSLTPSDAKQAPKAPRPATTSVAIPFVSACTFSHRGPDDPIVKPNRPGASDSHDFFGNATTAANSTLDSLTYGGVSAR